MSILKILNFNLKASRNSIELIIFLNLLAPMIKKSKKRTKFTILRYLKPIVEIYVFIFHLGQKKFKLQN